jgi:hypothetical protein
MFSDEATFHRGKKLVNFSSTMTTEYILIKETNNALNRHINILGARAKAYLQSYIITF